MRKFKVFAHSNCVRKASASGFYGLPAAGALVRFLTDARAAIDNHARPKVGRARTRPTRPVPAGLSYILRYTYLAVLLYRMMFNI